MLKILEDRIFHITSRLNWEKACNDGSYTAPSLKSEGFIHCSTYLQVQKVANARFAGHTDLVLLHIDPKRLDEPPVFEDTEDHGDLFPHVYGVIPTSTVVRVSSFAANEDGRFIFPQEPLLIDKPIRKLALFDIDSTLLLGSKGHKQAFREAFLEILQLEAGLEGLVLHGSTDPLLVDAMLKREGLPVDEGLNRKLCASILRHYYRLKGEDELTLMEGATDLLKGLRNRGFTLGLVTGNLETVGWGKLRSLNLDHHFSFGGFSCFSPDRDKLVEYALRQASECNQAMGHVKEFEVFLIGDALQDVRSARANQVYGIGVATGRYSQDELLEAGANHTLKDLTDFDFSMIPGGDHA